MPQVQWNLLLVEDDDIDREAIRRLVGATHHVHEAATAVQARRLLQSLRPDCVLLDYRLPDLDGLQLIPSIAAFYIPVIVITGEESPDVIIAAMRLGAQDYLVKGQISRTALEHAITSAIEKVGLRRNLVAQQQQLSAQAAALQEANEQIRNLASALTLAEQEERSRIAQVLHDHVQQMLHGVQLRTHLLGLDAPAEQYPAIQEHVAAIDALVDEALQATRTLAVELNPPVLQHEGLASAFQWLAEHMQEVHNLTVTLDLSNNCRLPDHDICVLVYQLTRELLFNVVKHAEVNQAKLTMVEQEGYLVICVEDHGKGFSPEATAARRHTKGGLGLSSIHQRLALFNGRLEVKTALGEGVRASIYVPMV
ncbi:MAG: response regulator [Caldilineaceae bacterium]